MTASPFAVARQAPLQQERLGSDERRAVNNSLRVPFRWVCALDIRFPGDPRRHRGSGVLIGPRQVLTVGHVIYRKTDGHGPESVYVAPARAGRVDPAGRVNSVAYSVSSRFLDPPERPCVTSKMWSVSRFDVALLTLESDVASVVPVGSRDGRPLGHWGHATQGAGTRLTGLETELLAGKHITVSGYPVDRCGRSTLARGGACDRRDWASVQFWSTGALATPAPHPGVLLHTADTHRGQSGAPVWMLTPDGRRFLVGIHLGARIRRLPMTCARLPIIDNQAVHLTAEVLAWVRSLMPGVPATR
jgi:V8-like Glu-specific endopeptidase